MENKNSNINIISLTLYIILNFLGYSFVLIFELLLISSFSFSYHLFQLSFSIFSIFLFKKVQEQNSYINPLQSQENYEIKLGENEPIIQFNLMPNVGCDICKIEKLPLRSHHCEICNKCVKCFDHHCWVLGGCIGENNKLIFLIFLFLQNCSIDSSIYALVILLKEQPAEEIKYLLTFYFSLQCLFGIIFLFIFVYHLYLFITNQTNFELFNEDQCPYILIYTFEKNKFLQQRGNNPSINYRYRPFDVGFKKNFLLFFDALRNANKEKNGINWEEIYYENLKNTHVNYNAICCDKK